MSTRRTASSQKNIACRERKRLDVVILVQEGVRLLFTTFPPFISPLGMVDRRIIDRFLYIWAFYYFFVSPTGFRWRALYGDVEYPEGYEIHGIDISHYQGTIDWEQLKNAMIKAVLFALSSSREQKVPHVWMIISERILIRRGIMVLSVVFIILE